MVIKNYRQKIGKIRAELPTAQKTVSINGISLTVEANSCYILYNPLDEAIGIESVANMAEIYEEDI